MLDRAEVVGDLQLVGARDVGAITRSVGYPPGLGDGCDLFGG